MFAEATLKGTLDRIWRYDETTFFRLRVDDGARSREASSLNLFTVALPKNVSRSMPRSLRVGQFVSISARPRLHEVTETLATFIKNATGTPPQLNDCDPTRVSVHRLQTDLVAKAIFILDEPETPQAVATLSGVADQRIWTYEDQLHFRMRVYHRPEDTENGEAETSFFTVVMSRGVSKSLPQRIEQGDWIVVETAIQQREHSETLATFLKNARGPLPDLGDYDAGQLSVQRVKVDFLAKTMIVRPANEGEPRAVRTAGGQAVAAPAAIGA